MEATEKRALYHLLRIHWLNDPTIKVEPWQVEDYRLLPLPYLFERLKNLSIDLNEKSFIAYAEESDSPEELTDYLIGDKQLKPKKEDQAYLIIFELWRRLMGEKSSLSILCDELDRQIDLYDKGQLTNPIPLQDMIANFLAVLEENVDIGIESKEAFKRLSAYCANDIETFLYDFIAEQIENGNEIYAQELIEDFNPYLEDNKWFLLLRIKLQIHSNPKLAYRQLSQLVEEHLNDEDLEFNLEILSFIAGIGSAEQFSHFVRHILPLLRVEEDFRDLLTICSDYYHRLDQEKQEQLIQRMLSKRAKISQSEPFDHHDQDAAALLDMQVKKIANN